LTYIHSNQAGITLFPTLGSRKSGRSLDDLLISLGILYKRGNAALEAWSGLSPDEVLNLRNGALALDDAFVTWERAQEKDFHPNTVFRIKVKKRGDGSHYPVGLRPGKVDTYLDHYIAGIWNLYRASRLSLLDLILKFSDALNDGRSPEGEHLVADFLVEGMLSSIPFHLAEDVHALSGGFNPGRATGGLLLMHSIFVTSKLTIVDAHVREYLRECLEWIGEHMGIGQASTFAQVNSPFIYLALWLVYVLSNSN
jgi:hypothetical protein